MAKKHKKMHPLELACENAKFDILGWIVERIKRIKENSHNSPNSPTSWTTTNSKN